VLVVGATNRVDSLDEALRRPGRFDVEVVLEPPTAKERAHLLGRMVAEAGAAATQRKQQRRRSRKHTDHSRRQQRDGGDADGSDGGGGDDGGGGGGDDDADGANNDDDDRAAGSNDSNTSSSSASVVTLAQVAEATVGFVAADLAALLREATLLRAMATTNTTSSPPPPPPSLSSPPPPSYPSLAGCMLECVVSGVVGASALRQHRWVSTPTTTWNEVGGCELAKLKLRQCLEWPRTHGHLYQQLNLHPPRGVLLYGPPGCAKTLLVKAVAASCKATFVSLAAADVYSPMVGDAEASVRQAFALARKCSPALLFFDELDALVVDRGASGGGSSSSVEARVLSTFLNEMDGIRGGGATGGQHDADSSNRHDEVLVVAATNRPKSLDAALLRPGRFEASVHIPAPDAQAREAILAVHLRCRGEPAADSAAGGSADSAGSAAGSAAGLSRGLGEEGKGVDLAALASDAWTEHFTGAELASLCREAAFLAMREAAGLTEVMESVGRSAAEQQRGEGSGGSGLDAVGRRLARVVVRQRHLEAAATATTPLLADPVKRALYASADDDG